MANWSAHTKHILPFNISNTTQVKTKVLKAPINKGKGAWACRHGLMPGKTRRPKGARHVSITGKVHSREEPQGAEYCRLIFIGIDLKLMRNYYYFTFTQYDTFIQYMKHQKI